MGKIRFTCEAQNLNRASLGFLFNLGVLLLNILNLTDAATCHADYLPIDQFFSEYSYLAPHISRTNNNHSNRPLVSLEANPKELLNNALRLAAREDRVTDIQQLIDKGADVNTANSAGMNPLMFAARNCSPKMAEILIKNKAEINASDEIGRTPLIFATRESCFRVVELLVKTPGIRCLAKDRAQKTALDYASEESRLEVDGASQKIMGLILFSGKS